MPGDTVLVFGDRVNVRTAPSKDASVAAQLAAGEEVIVRDTTPTFMQSNGLNQRWLRVAFSKNGARQEGYLWGGLLAHGSVQIGAARLIYGAVSAQKKAGEEGLQQFLLEVRAVVGGTLRSAAAFKIDVSGGGYYIYAESSTKLGLAKYAGAVRVQAGYEACGYTNYELYALWDGAKLTALPALESIADGGVFYHGESYLFPAMLPYVEDPDAIYLKTEHLEAGEKDENESNEWTKVRRVRWDGKQFVKPKVQ